MATDHLSFEAAKSLTRRLRSIPGFPWDEDNVVATAEDLTSWCKGAVQGQRVWTAEDQAIWLVDEVRLRWTEKWLGPGAMLRIFRAKFEIEKLGPERQTLDPSKLEAQYGKPDPQWARRLPQSTPLTDHWEKDRKMIALMRAEAARNGKDLIRLSHVDYMRLQIWAQECVGIEVTPEQRREVGG